MVSLTESTLVGHFQKCSVIVFLLASALNNISNMPGQLVTFYIFTIYFGLFAFKAV